MPSADARHSDGTLSLLSAAESASHVGHAPGLVAMGAAL